MLLLNESAVTPLRRVLWGEFSVLKAGLKIECRLTRYANHVTSFDYVSDASTHFRLASKPGREA
jgi:hypothetical protein